MKSHGRTASMDRRDKGSRTAPLGVALVTAISLVAVPHAQPVGADLRSQARTILGKSQDAVVTAALVVKMSVSVGGREVQGDEIRLDVPATIIDAGGLTVVALSSIDPSGVLKQMMPKVAGATPDFQSSLSEAKLRLANGREIPLEVVLRDADLDLAVLRPTEPQKEPFPAVAVLAETTADVLDDVVVLGRMGKVANWTPNVVLDRVSAKVTKPRPYLVLQSQNGGPEGGQPVFTPAGALLGIVGIRSVQSEAGGGMMAIATAMSGKAGNVMRVVIPVADVRELATQAAAKKP